MKSIYFVASHRYDLIQFYLIKEFFKEYSFNYTLLVTEELLLIKSLLNFVKKEFEQFIPIPLYTSLEKNLITRIFKIINLRFWYSKNFNEKEYKIIINDKSSPLSRFFIKREKNIILIQPLEKLSQNLIIDFKSHIYDYIRSFFYDSVLLKHYKSSITKGHLRYVELYKRNQNINVLINSNDKNISNSFSLPKTNLEQKQKKIVIFGNRFLSWKLFQETKDRNKWINELCSIYNFISERYAKTHECFYIPHPMEKGKEYNLINKIFLGNLKIKTEYFSSEHFLICNKNIEKTFSICSTSSRSSFYFGFDSKVLYKLLPNIDHFFQNIFYGMPKDFFPKRKEDLFEECIRKENGYMKNFEEIIFN